jgi:4-hydroxybenzoate polyprenyltransferase
MRLLHYWWPIVLGWSMTMVAHRATGLPASPAGLVALLGGILSAYSLDRVVDAPRDRSQPWIGNLLWLTGIIGALVCAIAASLLPFKSAALVPLLGAGALCYSRLKRSAVTKLVLLPVVWTWASFALPFNDGSWFGWRWITVPAATPLLLLVAAGCLLCDLKDEESDRQQGVRSLPAIGGRLLTLRIAIGLAAAAAALALAEHRTAVALSAGVLGLSTFTPGLLASDATGPLLVDVILTLPGILISARLV